MNTRLNQKSKSFDWPAFIAAVDKTHGMNIPAPRYRDFVKVHVRAMSGAGMSWQVHSMNMGGSVMVGVNFLSWHRWFLLQFERRLQLVDPKITIPYWDAVKDRSVPAALQDPALLKRWGLTREWDAAQLPTPADLQAVNKIDSFRFFQRTLEGAVHAGVHNAVGGDMAGPSSPTDPLFWLHHSNIDRIWSAWQKTHKGQAPDNLTDQLKPKPLFGVTVASVQSIATLGYRYA